MNENELKEATDDELKSEINKWLLRLVEDGENWNYRILVNTLLVLCAEAAVRSLNKERQEQK